VLEILARAIRQEKEIKATNRKRNIQQIIPIYRYLEILKTQPKISWILQTLSEIQVLTK
jgi:hypothetical protein